MAYETLLVKELMRLLQSHGIDFSFSWRSFVELYEEIYEKKQSRLEVNGVKFGKYICFFFANP